MISSFPIASLEGKQGCVTFDSIESVDWNSWDRFIERMMCKKTSVKYNRCLLKRKMYYKGGFILIRGYMSKTRAICVSGIIDCKIINNVLILYTQEYGEILLRYKSIDDLRCVYSVVSGFISGLYCVGLP